MKTIKWNSNESEDVFESDCKKFKIIRQYRDNNWYLECVEQYIGLALNSLINCKCIAEILKRDNS